MSQKLGVLDLTNEEYHATTGISRSKLWTFKQLPMKFWHEHLSGEFERNDDREAYVLGDLVHTLTLEPHKFSSQYMVMPSIDRRTKSGKENYANVMLEAKDKKLVKPETLHLAEQMYFSLMKNNTVCDLLKGARMENSIFWKHEPTGLICKARPDIWQNSIVSDLKTTLDAGFRGFQQSAYKYGYFLQAAMIYESLKSIGEPFKNFVFICIEKSKPFSIGLYMLDDDALQFGIEMFHSLMERLARCYETNHWPDYGIQKLTIPNYATMEVQGEQL